MQHRRLMAAAVIALALAASAAHARGQLQTRQTSIDLPAGVRAGRLVLANTGDAPLAVQVRVYAWTQDDGDDRLTPSENLVATPAIVEIPPGAEQLIRVVRPSAVMLEHELAFRVVVDQLPGDPDADAGSAVTVRMRYLIPAFVRAADPAPTDLHCRIAVARLDCVNHGGRAAQIGASSLVDAAGRSVEVTAGLLGYVLAGSTRSWPLDAAKLAALGPSRTLQVRLNGEPVSLALAPAP